MAHAYILMADVIGSSEHNSRELIAQFKSAVDVTRKKHRKKFLSPITITLGDECQAVIGNLSDTSHVLLDLEETLIRLGAQFKLRYIVTFGEIETEINTKIAYEMLGEGLTSARKHLEALKKEKHRRASFHLPDQGLACALNQLFLVLFSICDKWKPRDEQIVWGYLSGRNYKEIAKELGVDRSQIWKKEKNMMWQEYKAVRSAISYICDTWVTMANSY